MYSRYIYVTHCKKIYTYYMLRQQQQQQAGNKLLYTMVLIYTAMLVYHLIYDLMELGPVVRSAR